MKYGFQIVDVFSSTPFGFTYICGWEPMPVLKYVHLNVFSNQPFTGNQLAVFLNAEGIGCLFLCTGNRLCGARAESSPNRNG